MPQLLHGQVLWGACCSVARLAPATAGSLQPGLRSQCRCRARARGQWPGFPAVGAAALAGARVAQPGAADARTLTVSGLKVGAGASWLPRRAWSLWTWPTASAHEERQLNNSDLSVNAISAVHARFPDLAGQGLTASVKEKPFDPNDIDFKGRVVNPAAFARPLFRPCHGHGHAAGRGRQLRTRWAGAWPAQVRLATSDFARLLPDDAAQLTQDRRVGAEPLLRRGHRKLLRPRSPRHTTSRCGRYPTLLHVFSSGNSGSLASPSGTYQGIARLCQHQRASSKCRRIR